MKKLLLGAALAALLSLPATAATITTFIDSQGGGTATLTATNDAIQLCGRDAFTPLGGVWGTVSWSVTSAGSGNGITTEYTKEQAHTNFLAAPYSARTDAVTANPSTAPWANNTPVVASYETPIPGNAICFQIRLQTAGSAPAVVRIGAGAAYISGVPVVATLFDVTSAVNTAIDTGVLSMDGWGPISVYYVTPAGGSGAIKVVDDAGTAVSLHTVPASAATMVTLASGGPSSVTAVAASGTIPIGLQAKRMQFTSAQVAALTSRIRIEARR